MTTELPPLPEIKGELLCLGVVGSKLYGLDTVESDIDYKGVFLGRTADLLSLDLTPAHHSSVDPDITIYELGKFMYLCLKANPNLLELLYLPEYLVTTPTFQSLAWIRNSFLSERYVRDAYGGYAYSQFNRLRKRGDGSYSADTRKRTAKHTRHLFRLLEQGEQLLTTGTLDPVVADPERLFRLGDMPVESILLEAKAAFDRFATLSSCLPAEPDRKTINQVLLVIRKADLIKGPSC